MSAPHPTPARDAYLTYLLGLLAALLFVILPFFAGGAVQTLIDVTLSIVLVSAARMLRRPRWLVYAAITLTVTSVGLRAAAFLWPALSLTILTLALAIASLALISLMISIWVLGPGKVTGHRIRGAVLVYLLLGLTWALAYTLVEILVPGSFNVANPLSAQASVPGHHEFFREMTYYSFVTLTTVGYGDITPLGQAARQLAVLEGLAGQLFPVIVIGRMVALELSSD